MFYEVKNIRKFDSSYDVIEYYFPEYVENMNDDWYIVLRHFDDYESHAFCVINDRSVLVYDMICGDVYGRFDSLESFRDAVMAEVVDEVAE